MLVSVPSICVFEISLNVSGLSFTAVSLDRFSICLSTFFVFVHLLFSAKLE